MTDLLYQFPEKTKISRFLAKSKIFAQTKISTKLNQLFKDQVEKIIWSYKLAPKTTNISATKEIEEIQVFTIVLRQADLHNDVLLAIDKMVPSPILYTLAFEGKTQYRIAYKRTNEHDQQSPVVSKNYYSSRWIDGTHESYNRDKSFANLPVVLNLKDLYDFFVKSLMATSSNIPTKLITDESKSVERLDEDKQEIDKLNKKIATLTNKIRKEKQYNKRVELNQQRHKLQDQLQSLEQ